jgi:hypothetical protein
MYNAINLIYQSPKKYNFDSNLKWRVAHDTLLSNGQKNIILSIICNGQWHITHWYQMDQKITISRLILSLICTGHITQFRFKSTKKLHLISSPSWPVAAACVLPCHGRLPRCRLACSPSPPSPQPAVASPVASRCPILKGERNARLRQSE